MSTITTRAGKGSPLTNSEVDSNFTNLNDDKLEDAPSDGSQYARQNGAWAAVSAGSSYGDSDVDTHLNTSSASSNQILSWNGTDYAWVADQTGSGGSGGVTSYTNLAGFPSTGNSLGDLAVAQDTKALYMWDGSEWDRIATGDDESPVVVTEPPTTEQLLNTDGSTSTVTMTAQDPEGFNIVYGIAYNTSDGSRPAQLATDTTINQSTGVYTFDPTTTQSDAGSFKARLSASDGVKSTTRTVDFKLEFPPIIEILLVAGGGGGNDAAGGGGGAGGLVYDSSYQASSGTYTINVGSGGAKSSGQANAGSTGSDSSFVYNDTNVYLADGGGGGGPYPASSGTQDGGSGGGGGRATGGTDNGSATQASYSGKGFGNDGGSPLSNGGGGGGGGAGGAGGTATSSNGGAGGAGKAISITGSSVNYAPGGPGGGYQVSKGSYTTGSGSSYGAGGEGGVYGSTNPTDGTAGVCIIALQRAAASTTGNPTVDTSSRSGYYIYTFTGNGTITF